MKNILGVSSAVLLMFFSISVFAQNIDTVYMQNNEFQPPSIIINVGDGIIWINLDTVIHTTTSGDSCVYDQLWNSDTLQYGGSSTFFFSIAGSYPYFCIPHCNDGMVGNVAVTNISSTGAAKEFRFTAYPNPVRNKTKIEFFLDAAAHAQLLLFDIAGSRHDVVFSGDLAAGKNSVHADLSDIPAGLYFLQLKIDERASATVKVMKLY